MRLNMASIAILCLLLLERFLASDMDSITEPILNEVRKLERGSLAYTRNMFPEKGFLRKPNRLTRFYLFTQESSTDGRKLDPTDTKTLLQFNPTLHTKVIIHGFLDKVQIANWMHHMKDEFLMLDNFNVIIVDWSFGNFLPYTKAAANTEQVGQEISELLIQLKADRGAKYERFHLIGHSLGAHVAGYVGERVKGIHRITGLDPATYLFRDASPRSKLDKTDAIFVDVFHTDSDGIGMVEPLGHIDFYPNGGQVQTGCTTSNSLRSLLEHGVVEGARNVICSHMRATYLFTSTINSRFCEMIAYKCSSWEAFISGECGSCDAGTDCATLGYHTDTMRDYGNKSKYYLMTSDSSPFCGYEYKITLHATNPPTPGNDSSLQRSEWSDSDILQICLYGTIGNADFEIEGKIGGGWQASHVVFSRSFLGDILAAIIRWTQKPLTRVAGVAALVRTVMQMDPGRPLINTMHVSPLKSFTSWQISPTNFELCVSPMLSGVKNQQGATFRNEYCSG